MEITMPAVADSRLMTFNNLAVRCQDDAYTLAYYFLGEEDSAAEATQAAFASLYQRDGLRADRFRLEVLRRVLAACHQRSSLFSRVMARSIVDETIYGELSCQFQDLKADERASVILIDVLNLGYEDAAQVLGCSKKQVSRLLTQARIHLSRQAAEVL